MIGLSGIAAAADNAPADTNNPYLVISVRNVFHLNDPPPPAAPPEPPPVNLPKVMLTAFVGKGDSTKVYLAIPPTEAKESIFFTGGMVPGDRSKDVTLVRINFDEKKKEPKSVDILNSGTAQTLTIASNTYLASASSAPAAPGKGGPPGMPPGMGGLRHPPGGPPQPNLAPRGVPSAAATPGGGGSAIVAGGNGGGSTIIAGGNSGASYAANNYSGGAYVGGGGGAVNSTVAQPVGNAVGNQVATSLFSPTRGNQQTSGTAAPVAPLHVQAANLIINEAAGGPPSPINENFEPGGGDSGPPTPN